MAWKQLFSILSLLLYQIWVFEEMFGPNGLPDGGVPVCLLLVLYVASILRASHPSISKFLFLPWKAVFAANIAFFVVGSICWSIRWPGQCVRIGPVAVLLTLAHYWPVFVLRKLQGGATYRAVGSTTTDKSGPPRPKDSISGTRL